MENNNIVKLQSAKMRVLFDQRFGTIHSIFPLDDPFGTNFIGNEDNLPGIDLTETCWTGDVVSSVWVLKDPRFADVNLAADSFEPSGEWRREWTGCSSDVRQVFFDENTFIVQYAGKSRHAAGIQSYMLSMCYSFQEDASLLCDIEITNTANSLLELGELGLPLTVNNFYAGLWQGEDTLKVTLEGKTPDKQKMVHEQCVTVHNFVAGHSSYSLVQRPLGDPPFLLIHPVGDTHFEAVYKVDGAFAHLRHWDGPDVLAIHSWATRNRQNWGEDWINGCTSLILEPGETKKFQLRFAYVSDYSEVRRELSKLGNLGIRVLPSMVIPEMIEARVEILSQSDIVKIEGLSDGIEVVNKERVDHKTLLKLRFKGRGQKTVKLWYHDRRWTNLHFYCVEAIDQLLKARAKFIVERQFYDNPDDPFHRHHMFLPFNYRTRSTYRDADDVWEVGGSDEYGFSEPLFLAEKNVYYPSREEIAILETYVDDCLLKYIQDTATFDIQASLYWKERYLSSPWGHWTQKRASEHWRSYNYPHVANIYHALYQIGKRYDLITHHHPLEYLRLAYLTAIKWFTTGYWKHVGLMCGSNAINILNDLKREGLEEESASLREEMEKCHQVFDEDPYPYGSELFVDQTAHEQVFFFTRFFGNEAKKNKTLQVIKALRGGDQPAWFLYGNDKRGDMACWYSESLNGYALLKGFEDTGDMQMLLKGYAGLVSVMANLLPDGMGFGWFRYSPSVFAHDPPRTLDNGIGQYGFFKAAKAYVVNDPTFGLIGYGCHVTKEDDSISVIPWDGLKKRLRFMPEGIDIELIQGELARLELDRNVSSLKLYIGDSTGYVRDAEVILVGINNSQVRVAYGGRSQLLSVSTGEIQLKIPVELAGKVQIDYGRID